MRNILICVLSNVLFLCLGFAFGKSITIIKLSEHDKCDVINKELHKGVKSGICEYAYPDEAAEVPEEE